MLGGFKRQILFAGVAALGVINTMPKSNSPNHFASFKTEIPPQPEFKQSGIAPIVSFQRRFLFHLACAAFLAIAFRRLALSFFARAEPPFLPASDASIMVPTFRTIAFLMLDSQAKTAHYRHVTAYAVASKRLYIQKPPQVDLKYRAFIRAQACIGCGTTRRIEFMHVGPHGLGQKADDRDGLPGCAACHRTGPKALHKLGPVKFQEVHGVSFKRKQREFRKAYGRTENPARGR